jgi:hypothetical protein
MKGTAMTSHPPARRSLIAGTALHLRVDRGTQLACLRGRVRVDCAALWLAEQMVPQQIRLAEGEGQLIEHGGWIAINAAADAEIMLTKPASAAAACAQIFAAAWRLLLRGKQTRRQAEKVYDVAVPAPSIAPAPACSTTHPNS